METVTEKNSKKKSLKEYYPLDEVNRPYDIENLSLLCKKSWVKDSGFNKAIENGERHLKNYFKQKKSIKPLWDLLTYMGKERALHGIKYYEMPFDTLEFLFWVYNEVGGSYFVKNEVPAMDKMPYVKLYAIWKHIMYPEDRKPGAKMYKI